MSSTLIEAERSAELARRTGLSANLILKGISQHHANTTLTLERVLNGPAQIWSALDANHLARPGNTVRCLSAQRS